MMYTIATPSRPWQHRKQSIPLSEIVAADHSEHIERLTDVDHYGRAVCGHPGDFPEQTDCYMVGAQHVIYVGTASDISMEEMAALLEELYDAL